MGMTQTPKQFAEMLSLVVALLSDNKAYSTSLRGRDTGRDLWI